MELSGYCYMAVTVLCYLTGMGMKAWDRVADKWIPVIVGLVGTALGLICYLVGAVDFPARDPISAACIGAASGLAAVGINQIGKQMNKAE